MNQLNNLAMIKMMIMILLTSVGCNSSKNTTSTKISEITETKEEISLQEIKIKKSLDYNEKELKFKIKKIVQIENALLIDLTYGGGCVENHVFELYSTGKPDSDGVIDLFLLHKTEDNCKMLLMRQRVFDISKLTKRKSFNTFRINKGEILEVNKAK